MKIKHIKHNACRLLSLLLVVAALSGLLTIGAWAATYEQNTMTLSVEVGEPTSAGYVQAKIYASGTISASETYESGYSDGVLGGTFGVTVPEGLEFVSLSPNSTKKYSERDSKVWGLSWFGSTMPYQFAILLSDNSEDTNPETFQTYKITSWLGGDKVLFATAVFKVKDDAYGDQVIGISDDTVFYRGDTASTPVNLVKQSATLSLPSATLKFDANGHGTAPAAQTVAVGGTVTEPEDPTATGYTFGGWYTEPACTTEYTFGALNADTTVYAKWTPKNYTVTFDEMGGALPEGTANTKSVTYDSAYGALPTPTREGYKFGGWYLGETQITDTSTVTTADDHTLVAKWTEKAQIGFDTALQEFECGETIGYVPRPFVFEGTAPTEGYTVYYIVAGVETTTPPTAIGSYSVRITRAEDDTYQKVNQTIEPALVITKKLVTEPTQGESQWIYDGTVRNFTYTVGDDSAYTVTADSASAGTNAGTYTITFQLKDKANYQWKTTGNSDDLVFTYTIHKAELSKPSLTQDSFEYDGTAKTVTLTPLDDMYELVASTATATDAGIHEAKVVIKEAFRGNYKWADEDAAVYEIELLYAIGAKIVTAPTEGSGTYTYNASQQTYAFGSAGDEADYTVTGNKQKDAGTYTVTVSLKDKTNTAWADGTTDDLTFTFTIAKADQATPTGVTAENESIFKKGDGKITGVDKTMEYSADDGKTWTKISGNKLENLKPGEYKVRYAETDNCNASPDASVTVGEGTKLKASFNTGAGSDVDDQTNLGYGDALTKPEATYDGFTLVGWYKEDSYKHAWDFATDRMGDEDITLYAKWELSIGIEGDARFTEGKAPAEGVKIIVGKGLDQTADTKTIELQKVTVDGKKLDAENYTVAYGEDGLTITLKQEYLNTLADDEYEIGVVVESEHLNGTERKLSVTLTVDPVQGAAGKPAAKPGKAVKTGDSSDLLLWSVLTLGAGAGLVCIGKKRREN